jgi:hypothetical protein
VDYDNNAALEQPQRDEASLAMFETNVFDRQGYSINT